MKQPIEINTLGWLLDPNLIRLRNLKREVRGLFALIIVLTFFLFVI